VICYNLFRGTEERTSAFESVTQNRGTDSGSALCDKDRGERAKAGAADIAVKNNLPKGRLCGNSMTVEIRR